MDDVKEKTVKIIRERNDTEPLTDRVKLCQLQGYHVQQSSAPQGCNRLSLPPKTF